MTATDLRPTGTDDASHGRNLLGSTRRRRTLTIIAVGVVVLALFATWLVAFSSAFGVRSVEVRGLRSVRGQSGTAGQAGSAGVVGTAGLSVAEVEGRARVADGTPLVRVDTAAITARVESLPEVYSAEVSTSFPSTVVITVVERTPVGVIRTGGDYELVDRTGDAYTAVPTRPAGLPVLVVSTASAARSARRAIARVAAVLTSLPAATRPHVVSIQALAPDAITLLLTHDRVVQWGTSARSADKARVLPILLRKKSHDQFDVSDPDQPYSS